MHVINAIDKAIGKFTDIVEGISAILMALLTIAVFGEVMCRYVLKAPIVITIELTSLYFPWITCLSAICITRNNGHTRLTFVREKFSGAMQHAIEIFINVVMIIFACFMLRASYELCSALANEVMPLLRISKVFLYGSMCVGFAGIILVLVFELVKYICANIVFKEEGEAS